MNAIISARDFTVDLPRAGHARAVLKGITIDVESGSCLGIVGESGSGKSLLSRALLGAFPDDGAVSGSLYVAGVDVTTASADRIRALRQNDVAMVHQDPRASINPVHRIRDFLTEGVVRSGQMGLSGARQRAAELLERMRLPDPAEIMRRYPDELSGGMLQRVMIAGALMSSPSVLLCDEATTALDVTTQAEIILLLRELRGDLGLTLLFVTHDLELASELCDRICVLYAGEVMELGPTTAVLEAPRHPYTAALLESTPRLSGDASQALPSISGVILPLTSSTPGCVFADRCRWAMPRCVEDPVELRQLDGHRHSRCVLDGVGEEKS